jgi:hypothetical protein
MRGRMGAALNMPAARFDIPVQQFKNDKSKEETVDGFVLAFNFSSCFNQIYLAPINRLYLHSNASRLGY